MMATHNTRKQDPPEPTPRGTPSRGADTTRARGAPPTTANAFLGSLLDDLQNNRIALPSLPEVALKARQTVMDPDATAADLAKIFAADPALSARVVRIANSVLLRGRSPVTSLQTAIARVGIGRLRTLTACLVMEQVWRRRTSALIDEELKARWFHGTHVAALCEVIARRFTRLEPDQAMLAGLVHDIGALPVLTHAARVPDLVIDRSAMQRIVERLHARIGKMVLQAWQFPEELVKVVAEHENLAYDSLPGPDLVDVVIIANLHSHVGTTTHRSAINWNMIPAFGKLGLTPQTSIAALNDARDEVAEIQRLLTS